MYVYSLVGLALSSSGVEKKGSRLLGASELRVVLARAQAQHSDVGPGGIFDGLHVAPLGPDDEADVCGGLQVALVDEGQLHLGAVPALVVSPTVCTDWEVVLQHFGNSLAGFPEPSLQVIGASARDAKVVRLVGWSVRVIAIQGDLCARSRAYLSQHFALLADHPGDVIGGEAWR